MAFSTRIGSRRAAAAKGSRAQAQLARVANGDLCSGCGFCEAVGAPETRMELNQAGFLRPNPQLDPESAARAAAVCPGVHGDDVANPAEPLEGATVDRLWGAYRYCGVGHSTDAATRFSGSSGGVITELAVWLVESGRVDYVVVTGYADDDKLRTTTLVTSDVSEIKRSSGSKYAPSSPLSVLDQVAATPGRYAVIGKPCDITALRRAMNRDDPLVRNVEVLISFFCAGVPSDRQNQKLLERLGVESRCQLKEFRHRGNGWPGLTTAVTHDGEKFQCTYNESWGKVLNKDLQFRCKICPDGIGEAADIVAADAWYGDDSGYPSFQEADGRSLVMSRTEKGDKLLQESARAGRITLASVDAREIDQMQPGQLKRRRHLLSRLRALRLMLLPTPRYRPAALRCYEQGLRLSERCDAYLGTLYRSTKKLIRSIRRAHRA